ncbi:MAG TPA: RNA 2',3'-cyclic phosphodiesterase [Thermomicrobiales bacterium]|nr:RNA 2',3'-cyclic phosphodiesterase [Thermomicrobiales bacterium]
MATNRARRTGSTGSGQPAQRLFAAVLVSDAVREQMRAIRRELEPQNWTIRWVDPDLAHLTVKFFGDTRPNQIGSLEGKLAFAAERSQPATLTTGEFLMLGPRKRPNVLSLAIDAAEDDPAALDALASLAAEVDRQTAGIGAGGNERAFKAHLTLGRFKDTAGAPPDVEQALAGVARTPVTFSVDRLLLVRSVLSQQGPTYTTIAEWPLSASERAETPEPDDHG